MRYSSDTDPCNPRSINVRRRQLLTLSGAVMMTSLSQWKNLSLAHADTGKLKIRQLYDKDMSFSDLAMSLDGEWVAVKGYMAPPLKATSTFFVLTKRPMATCPFCNDADDWPDDILAIYTKRQVTVQPFNAGISVHGKLQLSDFKDPATGFFSRVRIEKASYKRG